MLVASDEATAGSVIRKAERISPSISGFSHLRLLLLAAVALQHFHVAGIGRGAVEHFRREPDAAHDFGERRVFEIAQPAPWNSSSSCEDGGMNMFQRPSLSSAGPALHPACVAGRRGGRTFRPRR